MALTARFLNPSQEDIAASTDDGQALLTPPATPEAGCRQAQHRLSESEVFQLVADYLDGRTVRQIAASWQIHRTTVLDHLQRQGMARRANVRKMTDDQVQEAAARYRNGDPLSTIARRYGVDPTTIRREFGRVGLPIRAPGRRRPA